MRGPGHAGQTREVISLTAYRQDSIWDPRGVLAFLIAPLLPTLVYAFFSGENLVGFFTLAAAIAYLYTLIFALPLAYLLNRRRKISLLTTSIGAALVGALPWAVFVGYNMVGIYRRYGAEAAFTNLVAIFLMVSFFGAFGMATGLVWWFIACYGRTKPAS